MVIKLILPVPPSVNALYFNRKGGRTKTLKYKKWLAAADTYLLAQKRSIGRIRGRLEIHVRLPKTRADIDNMLKAPLDYLVSREITGDDKHNWRVLVEIDEELDGVCEITMKPLDN